MQRNIILSCINDFIVFHALPYPSRLKQILIKRPLAPCQPAKSALVSFTDCTYNHSIAITCMLIYFYYAPFCPRCRMAKRYLIESTRTLPSVQIIEINSIREIRRTIQDGIAMVPAIRINTTIMSGIFLTRNRVDTFFKNLGNAESRGTR